MPTLPDSQPLSSATLAASWNSEYANGRYRDAQPLQFADDILAAAHAVRPVCTSGLYIGCGNGRNYQYLASRGLDLVGLDISLNALRQLADRAPGLRHRLVCADLAAVRPGRLWPIVIGIQIFHHGSLPAVHGHLRRAQDHVTPGGLFCLRVNAVGTDILDAHDIVTSDEVGQTVLFRSGAKRGQHIHYFAADELDELFHGFIPVLPARVVWHPHPAAHVGRYGLWEAVWRRP